ncbi:CPBP family intramembrane metalloprotease [bacterium]|nr:CPBP family intramembrane metalloprotease [bacterium]
MSGPRIAEPSLARVSTAVYAIMMAIGLTLMRFWQGNFPDAFRLPADPSEKTRLAAAGLLAAAFLLTSGAALEGWSPSFKRLKEMFTRLIGPTAWWVPLWLALLSSLGEEILFRGALQPSLGLMPTSIVFGLAHVGPEGRIGAWSFWAAGAGIVLGFTFQETGCLWPAIAAHFLVNGVSLLSLRRQYSRR